MSPTTWTLAIDFGTSNSAAAHSGATSGGIETLSLTHTSNLMPSAVYVGAPDRITVGDAAVDQAQQNPAGFVASPKRLIGSGPMCTVNGYTFPTYVLVAAVVGTILQRGKAAHAGMPPAQVVITHPEAWAQQQIRVLIDGAAQAGIDPARITTISEPRAAAAHYSRSHAMQPGARIAVFDFGGGTLDIAVLTVTNENAFGVVAARGNNGLGGKNLDALVQRWVEQRLSDRDENLVTYLRRQAPLDVVQSLQDSIRRAKELLSEAPSATITVPAPAGRQTLQITRDEFDELITPAVDQAMQLTRATLLDAGITHPEQLTALYLTGGSSRIPLVQQRLGELGPVATLDDPKTVVAQGALVTALAENAPNTNERATVVPRAGDLMPSWHAQPPGQTSQRPETVPDGQQYGRPPYVVPEFSGPDAAATGTGRRWGRIGAIAVAVVAVVGIVAGTIALMSRDNGGGDDPGQSGQTAAAATATGETGADGGMIMTDATQLMSTLPGPLREATTNCRKVGFTKNDAVRMQCNFAEDGELADLKGTDTLSYFMTFEVDESEAKAKIVGIRNGTYSQGKGTLVEDADRLSAADIDLASTVSTDYNIDYASTASSLVITVFGIGSVDEGKTFLTRSGLIS
ncbi:Hsp70 family protein [Gordonia hankookensis]|uniref:Hsp70 family protein n=1 Tax=Gordonia hankookensis TaxID=589403 RepID=A0ABR7WBU7_9ACTN|nr:Hsp70 family protein [Gordonia hankookensis]MBD1319322.1 Hsp70 family protein [Gordonia hankookensis]